MNKTILDMLREGKTTDDLLKELKEAETTLKKEQEAKAKAEANAAKKKVKLNSAKEGIAVALCNYFRIVGLEDIDKAELLNMLENKIFRYLDNLDIKSDKNSCTLSFSSKDNDVDINKLMNLIDLYKYTF